MTQKISLSHLKGKTVGVLGLGKTGHAVALALRAAEVAVAVWDDNLAARTAFSLDRERHIVIEPPQQWDWSSIDLLVLSPGLPYTHPEPHAGVKLAQHHGVPIVGDIELLCQACPEVTTIAITGTNGKSTTTSLIAHILTQAGKKVQVGGNLGTPALALDALGKDGIYVLELSSYQLDLVRTTQFDVAVLLNFSPDHIDRHGDMAGYIAAKKHIFERQQKNQVAIIGVDDPTAEAVCRELISAAAQKVLPIMTTQQSGKGIWVKDAILHNPLATPNVTCSLAAIATLQGTHNHQNAAAAYAACWSVGLTHEQIVQGMETYPGLAHRMQPLGEINGVRYINDSKATNADAAAKSLGTFHTIYWIAGGVAKEGGIASLAPFFPRMRHAFLIGKAEENFAHALEGHVPTTRCGTLDAAFAAATKLAQAEGIAGAVVLLAPACASFDQFKSFEHRGDVFAELVNTLKGTARHAV